MEIECPDCGESEFTMSAEEDKFKYGNGPKAVEVIVSVPVHTCACGFQFTDYEAEEIRDFGASIFKASGKFITLEATSNRGVAELTIGKNQYIKIRTSNKGN